MTILPMTNILRTGYREAWVVGDSCQRLWPGSGRQLTGIEYVLVEYRWRGHWYKGGVLVLRGRIVIAHYRGGVRIGTDWQGAIVLCAALELYYQ